MPFGFPISPPSARLYCTSTVPLFSLHYCHSCLPGFENSSSVSVTDGHSRGQVVGQNPILEQRPIQAPILQWPNPEAQVIVVVDTMNTSSQRSVMSNKTPPCAYPPRTLSYNVRDRELLAFDLAPASSLLLVFCVCVLDVISVMDSVLISRRGLV